MKHKTLIISLLFLALIPSVYGSTELVEIFTGVWFNTNETGSDGYFTFSSDITCLEMFRNNVSITHPTYGALEFTTYRFYRYRQGGNFEEFLSFSFGPNVNVSITMGDDILYLNFTGSGLVTTDNIVQHDKGDDYTITNAENSVYFSDTKTTFFRQQFTNNEMITITWGDTPLEQGIQFFMVALASVVGIFIILLFLRTLKYVDKGKVNPL